jgi:hypothetical protein
MPKDLSAAIDDWIASQSAPIGRPEAIRHILSDWLRRRGFLAKAEK